MITENKKQQESILEQYKPRKISFDGLISKNGWSIKTYTITNKDQFRSHKILSNVKKEIPNWLSKIEESKLPTYKQAFLIVHEAREGVWILMSWWTGGEMVETKVFFSSFLSPKEIVDSPYNTSSLLCVWELEVFMHERKSWIHHVLMKAEAPAFNAYQKDVINS